MWDLRFDNATKRGVRIARSGEPVLPGEFSVVRNITSCGWFRSDPGRYQYVDGVFGESTEWAREQAERLEAALAERARLAEIEQAIELAKIHEYTVEQAQDFINNKLDAATTAAEMKEAVRTILLKIVPYLQIKK